MKIENKITHRFFKFANIEIRIIEITKGKFISQYKKKLFFGYKWVNLVTFRGSKDAYPSQSVKDAVKCAIYMFSEDMGYPFIRLLNDFNNDND